MSARKPNSVAAQNLGSEYTDEERVFMMAVDAYKRKHNRPWPTLSEILAVAKSLGYRKVDDPREVTP